MEQRQVLDDSFFILLYGGVAMAAMIACCYLLFRRGNAFASEVTSPPRRQNINMMLHQKLTRIKRRRRIPLPVFVYMVEFYEHK